ncbi:MAG: sugar phosphate isomerase/epimerase, partial [Clostridia bacterium]|nr:sugar phosphate isomerase/epimerase [Clostridia bacterium]
MQTGISTASLFMRKNNEEALPLLNDLGVKTAEVFLTSFSEYGKAFGNLLAKVKGGLFVNSVHALNTEFEPQLFSAHPRVKGDAYGWLDKVLESANC